MPRKEEQPQELIGFGSNFFYALGDSNSADAIVLQHERPKAASLSSSFTKQLSLRTEQSCALEEGPNFDDIHQKQEQELTSDSTSESPAATDGSSSHHEPAHATIAAQPVSPPRVHARRLRPFWNGRTKASYESNTKLEQVVCTATSSVFRTSSGEIHQVGTLHGRLYPSPTRVEIQLPLHCIQLAAGRHFCLALLEGGVGVVSWGAGHFGQLGHGPKVSDLEQPQLIPHLLPRVLGMRVASIAAGTWHAAAIAQNGACWMWGSNRHGQCCSAMSSGSGKALPTLVVPTPVDTKVLFSQVACGRFHSVGLERQTGRVYTWGSNLYGQAGHPSSSSRRERSRRRHVRLVESLQRVVIAQVAAGDLHTLALTGGGRVFSWGCGMDGQLGVVAGSTVWPRSRPKLVGDLDFVAIAAGAECRKPEQATAKNSAAHPLSMVPRVISIQATGNYSVAVSSAGHVYAWGGNDTGVLGLPTPPNLPMIDPLEQHHQQQQQQQKQDVPSSSSSLLGGKRTLEAQSFDCKHDVWLPRRVDALTSGYHVGGVAAGPGHLWCWGYKRDERELSGEAAHTVIGRTLYELNEEKQRKGFGRLRDFIVNTPREFRSSIVGAGPPTNDESIASDNLIVSPEPTAEEDSSRANVSMATTASSTATSPLAVHSSPSQDERQQRPPRIPGRRSGGANADEQESSEDGFVDVAGSSDSGVEAAAGDSRRKSMGRRLSFGGLFKKKSKAKIPSNKEDSNDHGSKRSENEESQKATLDSSYSC